MSTLFWPIDVRRSGYCYGWTEPVLCVAGVVQTESLAEAQTLIASFRNRDLFLRICGSAPTILGACLKDDKGNLKFSSLDQEGKTSASYRIVYYHRHDSQSMRFYSFENYNIKSCQDVNMEVLGATNRYYSSPSKHDFTRVLETTGIDDLVINQFNLAKSLADEIHPSDIPGRTHFNIIDAYALPSSFVFLAQNLDQSLKRVDRSTVWKATLSILSLACILTIDWIAIVQQIAVRMKQFRFLGEQARGMTDRRQERTAVSSPPYVRFYSTVWLVSNDIIVGTAFGAFLCENHVVLARNMSYIVQSVLITWIQGTLLWLDSWPAGLKLNTELSKFYSSTFIDLVDTWACVLKVGLCYLPDIVYLIGVASCLGMTIATSLLCDLLCVLTAHIHVSYLISLHVYYHQLQTAGSLWNLFRGKRYNVIRNRTDTWDYDVDQLLFGTILFTLVAFLFPTVVIYYALFAMMRLSIILIYAGMETFMAFMNQFPLFALVLRFKDPWRLPGGILFAESSVGPLSSVSLVVENRATKLSYIFAQCSCLWPRLSGHYHPLKLLYCIFSGSYLSTLRYLGDNVDMSV